MEHFGFILASYLSTGLVLGLLAVWLVLDHRKQRAALQALEARGVRRRSDSAAHPKTALHKTEQVTE